MSLEAERPCAVRPRLGGRTGSLSGLAVVDVLDAADEIVSMQLEVDG